MDIAGEGDRVIMTWDGLVHWGTTDWVCSGVIGLVHSCLGGRSSGSDGSIGGSSGNSGRDNGFNGSGCVVLGMVTRRGFDEEEKNGGGL